MNGVCKNCGATDGLHHFETNQCPVDGVEARPGKQQMWLSSTFEVENNEIEDLREEVKKLLARIEELETRLGEGGVVRIDPDGDSNHTVKMLSGIVEV